MSDAASFVDVLRRRAEELGEAEAFTFLDDAGNEAERLSYLDLDRAARQVAAALQGHGLAGERALLVYPPGRDYLASLWGCFYAGTVAVPAIPPFPHREESVARLQTLLRDAQPRAVLTTSALAPLVREPLASDGDREPAFIATDETGSAAEDWRHPGSQRGDLALVQYTSGSTAAPRGVMVSHDNLLQTCERICARFEPDERRRAARTHRGMMWLPPYHDMGLIGGLINPVFGAGPIALMSPLSFLRDPLVWLRAISRDRSTISGGPDFSFDICVRRADPDSCKGLDLSCWELAFNGGEIVRAETIDAFAKAFGPYGFRREAFYPCYGLAEATLIVTGGEKGAAPRVLHADPPTLQREWRFAAAEPGAPAGTVVGCGTPAPGDGVAIVDAETREPRPDGAVGEIWISGPMVAEGYFNRPEESATTFGATVHETGEGPFLRTGDLGFVLDGELFVVGRIAELITVGDRTFYPIDIETECQRRVGVLRPGCGAAFTVDSDSKPRLVVVHETRGTDTASHDEAISGIRDAVAERFGLEVDTVALIEPRTIPKTSSGKIQRGLCRTLLRDGGLKVLASG